MMADLSTDAGRDQWLYDTACELRSDQVFLNEARLLQLGMYTDVTLTLQHFQAFVYSILGWFPDKDGEHVDGNAFELRRVA